MNNKHNQVGPKKILVAVAWPYVNGDLHVGHLAGYLLPADIFARYHRLRGNDVLMVSGSDCHGTPITVQADKTGKTPQEVVDEYHPKDLELFELYNLEYNLYTKTTTENHKQVTHDIFMKLLENGFIVKDTMKQYYATEDDQFLPDRYVEGECPHCHAKEQRSDQCENCGRWLEDGELINPYSKLTGSEVILKDTEHYFLAFEKLQDKLREYVDSRKDTWRNWVWQEANGWLNEGLRNRAITRDMDWSIELPVEEIEKLADPEKKLETYEGKRIYVWFEAVIGYLSAAIEWSKTDEDRAGIIFNVTDGQARDWQDWWLNDAAEHYYFMGQDNLVFHTLMWPGQLLGASEGEAKPYKLPENVFVNKFMNYEGKKFSKSRNWTIDSRKMAEKYEVDLVRYYIAANLPENKEANFTWEGFVDGVNNELVANVGNLINRTLKFMESKFAGEIEVGEFEKLDVDLHAGISTDEGVYHESMKKGSIVRAINEILQLAKRGNKYFDDKQVWQVVKENEEEAKKIMLNLLNLINRLALMLAPVLPNSVDKLYDMVDFEKIELKVGKDQLNYYDFQVRSSFKLLSEVQPLFPKLDRETVLEQKEN